MIKDTKYVHLNYYDGVGVNRQGWIDEFKLLMIEYIKKNDFKAVSWLLKMHSESFDVEGSWHATDRCYSSVCKIVTGVPCAQGFCIFKHIVEHKQRKLLNLLANYRWSQLAYRECCVPMLRDSGRRLVRKSNNS